MEIKVIIVQLLPCTIFVNTDFSELFRNISHKCFLGEELRTLFVHKVLGTITIEILKNEVTTAAMALIARHAEP